MQSPAKGQPWKELCGSATWVADRRRLLLTLVPEEPSLKKPRKRPLHTRIELMKGAASVAVRRLPHTMQVCT